jgi:hypothetical protein
MVIKDNGKPIERFVFSFHSYYKSTPRYQFSYNLEHLRWLVTDITCLFILMQWKSYVKCD